MLNEADTRVKLAYPKLHESNWAEEMIEREKPITKGQIINESGDCLFKKKPMNKREGEKGVWALIRGKKHEILDMCNKRSKLDCC